MCGLIGASCAAVLSACSYPTTCPPSLMAGIQVTVRDQQTGALIASQTTVVATLRGAAADSSRAVSDTDPIFVAWSAGTYDLIVRKQGYADLLINNIVVPSDGICHPKLVQVEARLTKTA